MQILLEMVIFAFGFLITSLLQMGVSCTILLRVLALTIGGSPFPHAHMFYIPLINRE